MLPSAYFILAWIHMRNGKVNDLVVVEVSARGELPTIASLPRIIPSQFGAINWFQGLVGSYEIAISELLKLVLEIHLGILIV